MKITPIYIKNLKLKNIRTFGEVELNFENEDETLPQWTIILGDNGIGKSTLLHSVAWMKPLFLYEKDNKISNYKPSPFITDEENDRFIGLVSKNNNAYKAGSNITANFQSNKVLRSKATKRKDDICYTSVDFEINEYEELIDVKFDLKTTKDNNFRNNEVLIYAYSASRTLGKLNIFDPEIENMIPDFINEKTILYDAEQILININHGLLGAKGIEKKRYIEYNNKVKEMLVSLLPDVTHVDDILVIAPRLVNKRMRESEVLITTKHGKKIPLNDFSLGYKNAVYWSMDLSWRLFNHYPDSKNALKEPAIVLIDEIDLHLHPKWQTEIIENLSYHFPNVQFIVTSHSPLMVQSDSKANFAVLHFNTDSESVEVINETIGVDGWMVDQILSSDFFGLKSTRGVEYDGLRTRRSLLIGKKSLTAKEKKELEVITGKLSKFPSGSPEEIEDRKIIRQIISNFKKSGKIIKI
ncbi:MAG TPA: AAA family ATPase [Flavobacterium sp.]|jgi:predicted ATP-binding protein involved in virulence